MLSIRAGSFRKGAVYTYHCINRINCLVINMFQTPKNLRNRHKQVLNNKIVWNGVSYISQYFIYVNKNARKLSFLFFLPSSHFIVLSSMYELWLKIHNHSSYFIIFMSHHHHCPRLGKLSETGGFQTVWNPTLLSISVLFHCWSHFCTILSNI